MRGSLDWSHELLAEPERRLFGRLSVFAGGWTLEAAEGVCSGGGIEQGDVLDLLGDLVNKSLVAVAGAGASWRATGCWSPFRQYAREKLEGEQRGRRGPEPARRLLPGTCGRGRAGAVGSASQGLLGGASG